MRNFEKYNIKTKYQYIGFVFSIYDKCGIYDISVPSTSTSIIIDEQIMDKMEQK